MKIDIHTHTKKCKSGDSPTREITPVDFCETVLSTEVRIIAITNHNVFDLDQYTAIKTRLGGEAQVWPGIELDVLEGESRGHLLVIVSPPHAMGVSQVVEEFTRGSSPDSFTATVDQVLERFDSFKLFVQHFHTRYQMSDQSSFIGIFNIRRGCKFPDLTDVVQKSRYNQQISIELGVMPGDLYCQFTYGQGMLQKPTQIAVMKVFGGGSVL